MRCVVVAALAAAAIVPAAASAQQSTPQKNACFFIHNWDGWRITRDGKTMYIRTTPKAYYRVDFVGQCRELTRPGSHPITSSHTQTVCSALDLDIQASNGSGFTTPCFVDKLTQLSSAEVAALPKQLTP
jgi:hypothetical protein